ncbi:universal stress protein [Halorubrum vacuolatum]|uniref:Nucleotide-binding universal stress protein, UspA family n=1 Tax=Halorubrum vacuolatum TaxID=63740 RepID=A0A238W0G2_HALVU|nr:universal stress protein [Halorubrum vacuolatum]SNR39189.1 Nucleotide-binding universal stress protein, UspA family [Halorubrum vacuolatum]
MYDVLLLPVAPDGESTAAIPHARSLAERYDATVHVVCAVDTLERTEEGRRSGSFAERVEKRARKRVESVVEALEVSDIEVTGGIVHDGAVDAIENAIDATDADLVVLSTSAKTGLRRVLLGSVTERIVRISPVPVVTVPIEGRTVDDPDA